MGQDARIDKLYPALTVRERAVMVLKAKNEDREVDEKVYASMSNRQVEEYNGYIALFNGISVHTTLYIRSRKLLVEQLNLRYAWLLTLQSWSLRASTVSDYFIRYTREPITEAEFKKLGPRRRKKPQWGSAYELFPDDQAEVVRMRRARKQAREQLARMPADEDFDLRSLARTEETGYQRDGEPLATMLLGTVVGSLLQRWHELRAIEVAVGEANEDLNGEDLLEPDTRQTLNEAKAAVLEIYEGVKLRYDDSLELTEPGEDDLKQAKQLVEYGKAFFDRLAP